MYYVSTEKRELVSIEELSNDIANLVKSNILNSCYPVGSIYMSMDSTSPSTLFGGTWDQLDEGKVLIGCNATYPAGSTGGEFTHTLTTAEMPSHSHTTSSAGAHTHGGGSLNASGTFTSVGDSCSGIFSRSVYSWDLWDHSRSGGTGYGITVTANMANKWSGATASAGAHTHTVHDTGNGGAHNNMQPYLAVYMWQRIL